MHSGFEIPGIHHPPQPDNPLLLTMNPTHILDQIHSLPTSQNLDHHHPGTAAYFPQLNFKLGFNETRGDANLLRGSEQYELPEARQSSLGMLHSQFWEPLPAQVSNENSDMRQREALTTCLDAKSRLHFSELEAIYKRETTQTAPNSTPLPPLPAVNEEESSRTFKETKKTKRRKKKTADPQVISPMAEFFENLVKQVVDHQENLQKKFTEVIDRLSEERRAREDAWRSQEVAHFEREAAARAHEKAMEKSREAMIVSYLEKITGQRINLPDTSYGSICGGGDEIRLDLDRN
ncbi:trihelix transcription factor DF1-like [Salvia divinorum]|uniref:Trihelix transcription factor DF1-like n=1 Tax=Salvia divinorum TaxID=28513 RepID=A0ABD1FNX8_SALDI